MRRAFVPESREIHWLWLAPIGVNLISAITIFLCAVLFKQQILTLFGIGQGRELPIHIVVEAFNDENGFMLADLYVVNLRDRPYTAGELKDLLNPDQAAPSRRPEINISWGESNRGGIQVIKELRGFNGEKGRFGNKQHDTDRRDWTIPLQHIEPRAVLKLRLETDLVRPANRNAKKSLPFKVKFGGREL